MARCPSCGQENPDGFRFFGACGASLAVEQPVAKAQVAAKRDEGGEASRLASESIDLADSSENFDRPIVAVEVAAFLEPDAARAALERAIAGALAKGNLVTAAQARAQLEAL
jgi:hypothetical protein